MTTAISPVAGFMLGYLYHGCLTSGSPLWLTKAVFDDGSCEIWGGVRNNPTSVGSWWTVSKVEEATADEQLEAYKTMLTESLPNGFARVSVEIV